MNSLSTAVYSFIVDNSRIPTGIDEYERQIGTAENGCNVECPNAQAECLNLSLEIESYLPVMPFDPVGGTNSKTFYSIRKDGNNNIVFHSCRPENNKIIERVR